MVIFLLRYKYKVLLFYFLLVLLLSYFFRRQHCEHNLSIKLFSLIIQLRVCDNEIATPNLRIQMLYIVISTNLRDIHSKHPTEIQLVIISWSRQFHAPTGIIHQRQKRRPSHFYDNAMLKYANVCKNKFKHLNWIGLVSVLLWDDNSTNDNQVCIKTNRNVREKLWTQT